ncbi:MAG TPA: hypothetical protein VFY60_08815, partial [Pyrinomonadaceae bacterium]|nr:hypothetical protein [Pyrinomonadaceae bacterium]
MPQKHAEITNAFSRISLKFVLFCGKRCDSIRTLLRGWLSQDYGFAVVHSSEGHNMNYLKIPLVVLLSIC